MSNSLISRLVDYVFGYDFFLSYSHKDGKNLPLRLHKLLEQSGFRVFLDQTGFVGGTDLRREAKRQVRKSRKLVVLGRPYALASKWVRREVDISLSAGQIPVLVDINASLAQATSDAPVASLAREQEWLRLEETLSDVDGEPSDRLVAELIRSFSHTRQETRRSRFFSGVTILLAGIAAIAVWNAYEAEKQRRLAEENLVIARKAADVLVVDIARNLRDVKGMDTASLHRILSKAREAFDKLSATAPADPVLLQSRLVMLNEFVETYLAQGDTNNAKASAQESLALAERLVKDSGQSVENRVHLSRSLTKVGDALEEIGSVGLSRQAHLRALDLRRQLLNREPSNTDRLREVTVSLIRLGQLEVVDRHPSSALTYFEEAMAARKRLATLKPAYQRDLALLYLVMSDAAVALDTPSDATEVTNSTTSQPVGTTHLAEAGEHARAAATLFEQILLSDATNTKAARDYATALQYQGNVALLARNFDAARKYYQASANRYQIIAEGDANNLEWRRDQLVAQGKLAAVQAKVGDRANAVQILTMLVEQRGAVVKAHPDNHIWRVDLIEALYDLAALTAAEEANRLLVQAREHLLLLRNRKTLGARERKWLEAIDAFLKARKRVPATSLVKSGRAMT